MSTLRDELSRTAKTSARPFLAFFNRRFEDVHRHIDERAATTAQDAANRVAAQLVPRVEELLMATRDLQRRVAEDLEIVAELTVTLERFADRFAERVDAVVASLDRQGSGNGTAEQSPG